MSRMQGSHKESRCCAVIMIINTRVRGKKKVLYVLI